MQVIGNRVLLFVTKKADQITSLIPKSRIIERNGELARIAVNWGFEETKLLRNLKIKDVPSPILGRYDWPGIYEPFSHQKDTAAFLTTHPRCFVLSEAGCVDSDTEYLTPTGWKRIADYAGEQVAQFVPETGRMEFVTPTEYIKKPCDLMVRMQTGRGVDQLLSPEHRVLAYNNSAPTKPPVVLSAQKVLEKHDRCYAGVKDPSGPTVGVPTVSYRHMAIRPHFIAPSGPGIALTDAELRLQIAVIADGHFGGTTNHCVVRLKRLRKIERMRRLLEDAHVPYRECKQATATAKGFVIFTFNAPWRTKEFDAEFWNASTAQLEVLRNEVMHWDGCDRKGSKGLEFSSTSKASADFVQYIFAGAGYITRIGEDRRPDKYRTGTCYSVYVRQKTGTGLLALHSSSRRDNVRIEPSTDGFKYCFSVPSTFLVLRRNGCIFTTGNTGKTSAAAWAADYLMKQGEVKRALVVCPVSIMETAWRSDLFKTAMHRSVAIATGTRFKRNQVIAGDYEFVVINFDGVKVAREALEAAKFDLIIVDEANAVKSVGTQRWKALNSLIRPDTRVWLMTGTPASQSPVDAYGLAKLVNPAGVPKFFGAFRDQVMTKITQFKWVPKANANDIVFNTLQPAIRFTKEECLDLPDLLYTTREIPLTDQQTKYYEVIRKKMMAVAAGEQITAVNAAGLLNKLLQISCIAEGTFVLTYRGWVPIQSVTATDLVWDGEEWVPQAGAVYMGDKPVVDVHGVLMTLDHKVLTNDGWKTADDILKSYTKSKRLARAPVRLPYGCSSRRSVWRKSYQSAMDLPLRLRELRGARESVSEDKASYASAKLRMPSWERKASNGSQQTLQYMGRYARAMQQPNLQGLEKLWRTGYYRLRAMARVIRKLLGRYGACVFSGAYVGSYRQLQGVLPGQLQMGHPLAASKQHSLKCVYRYAEGSNDDGASRRGVPDKACDLASQTEAVRVGPDTSSYYSRKSVQTPVYDLVDCGPRNRYVVRGPAGNPLIVHNCGSAYTVNKEVIEFDISSRFNELKDVIDGTNQKVIVFAMYRHVIDRLEQDLIKDGYTVGVLHGGVSAGQRAVVVKSFQSEADPKIIIAHPAAAGHGLTLTRADTIVWWGPVTSAELYIQGNARAHRAGQRHPVTVVRLQGSPVEKRMYTMLDSKVDMHQGIVDLFKQELDISI